MYGAGTVDSALREHNQSMMSSGLGPGESSIMSSGGDMSSKKGKAKAKGKAQAAPQPVTVEMTESDRFIAHLEKKNKIKPRP